MLTLLSEVCASLDENPIVTLQFKGQEFQTLYYVLGNEDLQIGDVTYLKSNIQVSLPERTNSGFGDINIGICNVNNQVYAALKQAIDSNIVLSVRLDLRIPDTLASDYDVTLNVKGVVFQEDKVQITASAADILNCEFPKNRYTAEKFPGLKYVS